MRQVAYGSVQTLAARRRGFEAVRQRTDMAATGAYNYGMRPQLPHHHA